MHPRIGTHRALHRLLACALLWLLSGLPAAQAQGGGNDTGSGTGEAPESAFVVIDGERLFPLRGITAFPAKARAAQVRERIIELARDQTFEPGQLVTTDGGDRTTISRGDRVILHLVDPDAELEGIDRGLLAETYLVKIGNAVGEYRRARSPDVLLRNTGYALVATVVAALLLWALMSLFRWLQGWVQRRVQGSLDQLASRSHNVVRAQQLWGMLAGLLRLLRVLALVLLAYFFLNTVLGLYPWTRPAALVLFDLVLKPLESMGRGLLDSVPDLAFLAVLVVVVRAILKVVRAFFNGVEHGRIPLRNFDPEWALPTYKLARLFIIAFSLVIAYPYIPGSSSLAFKGVTVFMGVILSLGSSSFIAALVAGLTMTYRGAFKKGDFVNIGDTRGVVEDIRLMVTRVRTTKNEIVVIPNSTVLTEDVVNYSIMARSRELFLHTEVGIGYDTPWRQVEAMLLEAARRTEGVLEAPPPFVLQKSLGDFTVVYELNAATDLAVGMMELYSRLHANIQDVFNENGVQIMSPNYVADPSEAKLVPPERWYEAPAQKPGGG